MGIEGDGSEAGNPLDDISFNSTACNSECIAQDLSCVVHLYVDDILIKIDNLW